MQVAQNIPTTVLEISVVFFRLMWEKDLEKIWAYLTVIVKKPFEELNKIDKKSEKEL